MRLAIAQIETAAGDFSRTVERVIEAAARAHGQGASLVIFPFATFTGCTPVTYPDQGGFMADLDAAMGVLAERLCCPCLVPLAFPLGESFLPEAVLIGGGMTRGVSLTSFFRRLSTDEPLAGLTGDSDDHAPGALPSFELDGIRFGVAFDYDGVDDFIDAGADIDALLFISSLPFGMDDRLSLMGSSLGEGSFSDDASDLGSWLVGVGSLGVYDTKVFTGSSFALTPWGEIAAQSPSFEEDLLVFDLDPSFEGPLDRPLAPEVGDRMLSGWNALRFGLSGLVEEVGHSRVTVLLDGSLGSCAVAALASDALGPTNVSALAVTGLGDREDACIRAVAQDLRLTVRELPLSALSPDRDLALDLARAHQLALARETSSLPLLSSDKTALAMGTAPAGVAGAVCALGDVYYSDLVNLAHFRNTISPVIPQSAFAGASVPDVPGIEDCGFSAEERMKFIDLVLSGHVEWGYPVSRLVEDYGHEETVLAVVDRLAAGEPLRRGATLVLTASSKTLDEFMVPLGLRWHDRVRDAWSDGDLASSPNPSDVAFRNLMARLGTESAQSLFSGAHEDQGDAGRREFEEVMGFLRDLSITGGLMADGPESGGQGPSGRHGAGTGRGSDELPGSGLWRTFSEN